MIFYIMYRLGAFLANIFPLGVSYAIASLMASVYFIFSKSDRNSVSGNILRILGPSADRSTIKVMTRGVFRNFAKYLVDFFRFASIDEEFIKHFVKFEGLRHVDEALSKGKGVILLSAHIGNWELGGAALSRIGYPVNAVVLTHRNKKINDFFRRQREIGTMRPIEIGPTLKSCYCVLKSNGMLALLGDRDFTKNGIMTDFFGKSTLMPRGPAALSHRLGSAIVPTFMIRQKDDTFKLVFEPPMYPAEFPGDKNEEAVVGLMREYLSVIEHYIRLYPDQWFVFRNIWSDNEILRPDTVI